MVKCAWNPYSSLTEPTINCARIMHGQGIVLAGTSDDGATCKAFNIRAGGQIVHEYPNLSKGCYAIDVAKDGSQVVLTDSEGKIKMEYVNYMYLNENKMGSAFQQI
mgnify:CR=1 FL=1|jgi:hypothetical protein